MEHLIERVQELNRECEDLQAEVRRVSKLVHEQRKVLALVIAEAGEVTIRTADLDEKNITLGVRTNQEEGTVTYRVIER